MLATVREFGDDSKPLVKAFKVTCKQSNMINVYIWSLANKLTCKGFASVYLLTSQLSKGSHKKITIESVILFIPERGVVGGGDHCTFFCNALNLAVWL